MENLLLKKLRIKSGDYVKVVNLPSNDEEIFGLIPNELYWNVAAAENVDSLLLFAKSKTELDLALSEQQHLIARTPVIWILYPKSKSILAGDLNLMKSWQDLTKHHLEPCASASIDTNWTAIRVKVLGTRKNSGIANQDIKQNEFGQYIDVTNRKITLPEDVERALNQDMAVAAFYNKLAYSHQKEYLLWILTAKQEKTRNDRITKMIEKLTCFKKNPTEK